MLNLFIFLKKKLKFFIHTSFLKKTNLGFFKSENFRKKKFKLLENFYLTQNKLVDFFDKKKFFFIKTLESWLFVFLKKTISLYFTFIRVIVSPIYLKINFLKKELILTFKEDFSMLYKIYLIFKNITDSIGVFLDKHKDRLWHTVFVKLFFLWVLLALHLFCVWMDPTEVNEAAMKVLRAGGTLNVEGHKAGTCLPDCVFCDPHNQYIKDLTSGKIKPNIVVKEDSVIIKKSEISDSVNKDGSSEIKKTDVEDQSGVKIEKDEDKKI